MGNILARLNTFFENLPDFVRDHRKKIWAGLIVSTLFLSVGIGFLKFDMTMESWFRSDDPAVIAFNQFRYNFGGDDSVYIVYKAKDGDIFSFRSLTALKGLQEELSNIDPQAEEGGSSFLERITEVTSLINVSYMSVDGDTLISREFVGEDIPVEREAREKLRKEALEHKDYPLFYLSKDSRYGAILIKTDFGTIPVEDGNSEVAEEIDTQKRMETVASSVEIEKIPRFKTTDMLDYARFTKAVVRVLDQPKYSDVLEFYPVGNPVLMAFFDDVMSVELSYLMTLTLIIILLCLHVLFRSFAAVVWPISLVILTTLLSLGIFGWMGVTFSMLISITIFMILVVGVADSVHILSGYMFFRREGHDHRSALRACMRKSGFACLLTSVTTSIGLLSMIFVPIPPIAIFGVSTALGIMLAFVLTVVVLPLMLDIWQPVSKKMKVIDVSSPESHSLTQRFLRKVETASFHYPVPITLLFFSIGVLGIVGMTQVKVDSNMVELMRKNHPTRKAFIIADKVMGGTQGLEIYLDFKKQDALKDPRILNAMDRIQHYMETTYPEFVVNSNSLVNVVKNSFQVLNENRPEMYRIPQQRATLEQTLIMFDSANSDDRQELVTDAYDRARISARLKNYGSIEYLRFFEDVKQKVDKTFSEFASDYPGMSVELTGGLPLMMVLVDYMSWSQIESFSLSLLVISIILLFVFGSIKLGLISIIPNLFPVMMTFGAMGFFNIPLDGDTLIIAPIVIGIAVDDTIHFMTHFRIDMEESGDIRQSIINTVREVGQAMIFSTIILVLGFWVLVFSDHMGMAHFGYLTAIAFISALLADLFLLPSLCVLVEKKESDGVRSKIQKIAGP